MANNDTIEDHGTNETYLKWSLFFRWDAHLQSVKVYDDEICIINMHDSPVAFTSSDGFGALGGENDGVNDLDGVTDWSGNGGTFGNSTCDHSAGNTNDPTVTCNANSLMVPGQLVTGEGILAGSYVGAVDTPGAVTTFELTDKDGNPKSTTGSATKTNIVLTFSNGISEIQARPSDQATDASTYDIEANNSTINGVRATLGYSKFNQYRWGHDYNGTHDLETDNYTTTNTWNTWNGYKGEDGYGHYNMVTTTFCSIFDNHATSYALNQGNSRATYKENRMRCHGVNYKHDGVTAHTWTTSSNNSGTGYFTWYANKSSVSNANILNATDEELYGEQGSEDSTGHGRSTWTGADRGFYENDSYNLKDNTNITGGSYTPPTGTQWQNRRIVQCWSTIPTPSGGKNNETYQFIKSPKVSMREVNGYLSKVLDANGIERHKMNKVYSMETIFNYYTLNSTDKYMGATLLMGRVTDNNNETRTMALVMSNAHVDGNTTLSSLKNKNLSSMRPLEITNFDGVQEIARRAYANNQIVSKNLCHGIGSAATNASYAIYSPILVGNTSSNLASNISIWRRSAWLISEATAQGINLPHYNFDKLFDYVADADADSFGGIENSGNADVLLRFPNEFVGSHMGTGVSTADTTSGTASSVGAHVKASKSSGITDSLPAYITSSPPTTDGHEFQNSDLVEYKFSYLYDGFQDSTLSTWSFYANNEVALSNCLEYIDLEFSLGDANRLNLNKRVTDILIWRRNNKFDDYRYVDKINLDIEGNKGADTDGNYSVSIRDEQAFETYQNITGISQTLTNPEVNFSISAQVNDYMFIANCWHKKFEDTENIIFRSKSTKFSMYDWSTDFLFLPHKPTALASYGGKLYAFSRERIYRINPDSFYIENVMDGIGVMNQNSVIVTDYGMFFCDANSMYLHDGTQPKDIGASVSTNTDNKEWSIGWRESIARAIKEDYYPLVQFDGKNKCVYFIIKGLQEGIKSYSKKISRAYAYYYSTGKFDYVEMPPIEHTLLGKDGDTLLADGYQVYSYRKSLVSNKKWSWSSKEFDMGSISVKKVWKSIKLAGAPTFNSINNTSTDDIKVFVDGVQKKITIENKNYTISKTLASGESLNIYGTNKESNCIYGLNSSLPSLDGTNQGLSLINAFDLDTTTMPEFVSGDETVQHHPVKRGDIETLKYLKVGQYIAYYK